jgi:hypothetical protein
MGKPILLAAALLIGMTPVANAVGLKDCSKGTTGQRLACLQANTVLLNSSYQTVAAELRQEAADLKKKLGDLQKTVDAIKMPDLSNVVRWNDSFKLGFDVNRCLTYPTGVNGIVAGPNPPIIQAQTLVLLQECPVDPFTLKFFR